MSEKAFSGAIINCCIIASPVLCSWEYPMKKINMRNKTRVEYTSVALTGENWRNLVDEGIVACEQHGFEFGIQIHNTATETQIREISALGLKMSFHAPVLDEFQINLASEDPALSAMSFARTAGLMRGLNVKEAVFHGFNMTDHAIPSFGRGRDYEVAFAASLREELSMPGSTICNDFFGSEEYRVRSLRVSQRLAEIRRDYSDLVFLLENDFPAYGAGSVFAEHMVKMGNPICVDSSHLWASCFIFDRDFHAETEAFLKSGLVGMVHLHASVYTSATPKAEWSDGHMPLNTENRMELPRFIRLCEKYGVSTFILEINGVGKADIDYLASYLQ